MNSSNLAPMERAVPQYRASWHVVVCAVAVVAVMAGVIAGAPAALLAVPLLCLAVTAGTDATSQANQSHARRR